ncbi:cupin domain-containing protein [Cellulomonas fengjieae]|uniref:cupin domain-containing protein n=1 Tax=Cellulomonas fengjieae TaxID=2819978 RepID=UPI001AAF83E1|nr:cupin domain-containing protein [Cellulomonas fengjieae]MBO3103984.1 cupin-like domain-containing protein [Cellulomonas fengjieae]
MPENVLAERGPVLRSALSRCINVPREQFAQEVWGRTALLSPANDDFTDLLSPDAVDELVGRRGLRTPFIRLAHEGTVLPPDLFTASGGFGAEVSDQVSSDKVLAQFAAGATIVLQGLHRMWPPLVDFTRQLVEELGHPAQVNAYVTPPSSQGFAPHYDTHDVFVLQVSGEKHWVIHAPVHPDPLKDQVWTDHRAAVAQAGRGDPVIDQVLRPGDALYLPRGWIHSATALGDTSIHLTVGLSAYTRADVVDTLLSVVGGSAALRASLPLGIDVGDPDQLRPIVEQTVSDLVAALSTADDLAGLSAGRLGARFGRDTRPEPVAPLATLSAITALSEATAVRWRHGYGGRIDLADGRVRLTARGTTLSMPVEAAPALEVLRAGHPITVGALPGLDLASALVVVRRLLREGVVVTSP